jgi:methylenetetrahydrofolate reductase (NADPH)
MAVALRKRRTSERLTGDERSVLRSLVAAPMFELVPLKNALVQAEDLPPGATVTVTASPSHTIEATLDLAEEVSVRGHAVTPHLSAHMIRDRAHLAELLRRMDAAGLRRAFVVGGDSHEPGDFRDGLSLLRAIDELGRPFDVLGVPSYPQGHVDIADDVLVRALLEKQRYASYMTTQMCFEPEAILAWIPRMRLAGVTLPIHLGMPGVAEITRLMAVATRIGLADSARYLKKNRKIVGHLLSPGKFGPDAVLEGMASALADPGTRIEALHLFTFNQVASTVEWQRRMLESLADNAVDEAEA